MGETYAGAGVSLDAGDEAVRRIGPSVRSTRRREVIGGIGGFGGLFDLAALGYADPILVSTTDGVGTKALVAAAAGRVDSIGIDLVAMCVDDLVCQGAEPLFFLDYVSVGRLDPDQMESLVGGVANGCRQAGCALVGGEMAEHPGAMAPGDFDLVGFAVGAVERSRLIDGSTVAPGDVLIGLTSPNLRSNGYSLARRVLLDVGGRSLDDPAYEGAERSLADELLSPSVIYAPAVLAVAAAVEVRAVVHVTGGGIVGNLPRVLPEGRRAVVDVASWPTPPIFGEIQRLGSVSVDEMFRVFNMGVGMVVCVGPGDVDTALEIVSAADRSAVVIGEVVAAERGVELR